MSKILIVEDNELNRDMLSRRLKRRGYEVLIAVDGAEGVSTARSEHPDLILMDMSLPVMNGWQATKTLKAETQTAAIPIIALTAHAMVGDRNEAIAAGCDDYDTKPVDLKRLLQKIEGQLQTAQTQPTDSVSSELEETIVSPVAVSSDRESAVSPALVNAEQHVAATPLVEPQSTPSLQNSPAIEAADSHPLDIGLKLLVVDDNEANRDMLSRRLERKGYEIVLADSGESALQVIASTDIALVLLDIMMPGIGGIETLKRLRQSYSQAQLPIIMATAKDTSEDIVEALELGANDYITKPIDLPVALARIQTHLKTRKVSEISAQQLISTPTRTPTLSFWNERFRLVKVLRKLPLGQTVIAHDLQTPDTPLRIIHTFRLDTNNPEVLQFVQDQFLAEIAILKQLPSHQQCLPLLSHLQEGEVFYMVHNYIEGTLLSQVLEATSPLPAKNICKIADELLTVIDFLHQSQLIHSHPHPDSFLQPLEKSKKLVLIDYGIATRILSKLSQKYPQYQKTLQMQGDAFAPELMAGNFNVVTDQYAMGKTLLQALKKHEQISTLQQSDLLNQTTQIFTTMCQANPSERYESIYDAGRAVRNHWHQLWKVELSK